MAKVNKPNEEGAEIETTIEVTPMEYLQKFDDALNNYSWMPLTKAVRNIADMAKKMEPETVRTQLIPRIQAIINCLNDDSIIETLQQLERFQVYVGGVQHFDVLLELFKVIILKQTKKCQQKAVQVLVDYVKAADLLPISMIETEIVECIVNLENAGTDEVKISIIPLIIATYHKLDSEKNGAANMVLEVFKKILNNCLTREKAAKILANWVNDLDLEAIEGQKTLGTVIADMAFDKNANVQIALIDIVKSRGKDLKANEKSDGIFKGIITLSYLSAENVQKHLIKNLPNFLEFMDKDVVMDMHYSALITFNTNVRAEAVNNLLRFCEQYLKHFPENFEEDFTQHMVPRIRMGIGEKAFAETPILSKELIGFAWILNETLFAKQIIPIIEQGFDEFEDHFVVAFMKGFDDIPDELTNWSETIKNMQKIVETLMDLNMEWRFRARILVVILKIALKCTPEDFNSSLSKSYLKLLCDGSVYVRRTATVIFPILLSHFGTTNEDYVLRIFDKIMKRNNGQDKITGLFMLNELMFPSIIVDDLTLSGWWPPYLDAYKDYLACQNAKYKYAICVKLYRIERKNQLLQTALEKPLKDGTIRRDHEYNREIAAQITYSEDNREAIKKCYTESLYGLEEHNFRLKNQHHIGYLERVITALTNKRIAAISDMVGKSLDKQCVKNILSNMFTFSNKIKSVLEEEWAIKAKQQVKPEYIQKVDNDIRNLNPSRIVGPYNLRSIVSQSPFKNLKEKSVS